MSFLSINPTQWLGVAAFALSAAACTRAAARCGRSWAGLAWLQVACAAEVVVNLRQHLHGAADGWLAMHGEYATRLPLQMALVAVTLAGLAGGVGSALAGSRSGGAAATLARAATCAAITLFIVESISLHAVDAVMFAPFGPVLAVGWMWAAAAGVVIVAASTASNTRISQGSTAPSS